MAALQQTTARPGIRRRFSIMATVENRYLILGEDGRPVPTEVRPRPAVAGCQPIAGAMCSAIVSSRCAL